MRVEPHDVGSIMHALKRGGRGLDISHDLDDKDRFLRLLYYFNDENRSLDWEREINLIDPFTRPAHWSERKPLVNILAWTLMPNHFHLLLEEIQVNGISRFMQGLCGSMSKHFNEKYEQRGSLFQSSYKARTVRDDDDLRHLACYIMVKNVFELYPGGLKKAAMNFDLAWAWALEYRFSSFANYATRQQSPIIEKSLLAEVFPNPAEFKRCARDMILGRIERMENHLE